jgi:hypothetical protein
VRGKGGDGGSLQGVAVGGEGEQLAGGPGPPERAARVEEGEGEGQGGDEKLVDGGGKHRQRRARSAIPKPVRPAPS